MSEQLDFFNQKSETPRTRTDQLLDSFSKFHENNPDIWKLFQRFALDVINSGQDRYSANAIFERIRWHVEIDTKGSEVKLSNNHRAYYARLFHLAHPQHDGFFRNRRLRSEDVAAYQEDIEVFHSGPPSEEDTITRRLTEILNTTQHEDTTQTKADGGQVEDLADPCCGQAGDHPTQCGDAVLSGSDQTVQGDQEGEQSGHLR